MCTLRIVLLFPLWIPISTWNYESTSFKIIALILTEERERKVKATIEFVNKQSNVFDEDVKCPVDFKNAFKKVFIQAK